MGALGGIQFVFQFFPLTQVLERISVFDLLDFEDSMNVLPEVKQNKITFQFMFIILEST